MKNFFQTHYFMILALRESAIKLGDQTHRGKVSDSDSIIRNMILHTYVHGSIMYNSQKMEATQCPLMDE